LTKIKSCCATEGDAGACVRHLRPNAGAGHQHLARKAPIAASARMMASANTEKSTGPIETIAESADK